MAADDSSTFEETAIYDYSSVSNFRTFRILLAKVAGLPLSVHDFRYSHIKLLNNGGSCKSTI